MIGYAHKCTGFSLLSSAIHEETCGSLLDGHVSPLVSELTLAKRAVMSPLVARRTQPRLPIQHPLLPPQSRAHCGEEEEEGTWALEAGEPECSRSGSTFRFRCCWLLWRASACTTARACVLKSVYRLRPVLRAPCRADGLLFSGTRR